MATSGFEEIFNSSGNLVKIRGHFGYSKEVCLSAFAGGVYLHISDKSKCFSDGKFDLKKSKSVSLKWDDCSRMIDLVKSAESYVTDLKATAASMNVNQQVKQPMPYETHQQEIQQQPRPRETHYQEIQQQVQQQMPPMQQVQQEEEPSYNYYQVEPLAYEWQQIAIEDPNQPY